MDTSILICGLTFKNPVLPASGPLTEKPSKIKQLIDAGVGAIVTKTISIKPAKVPRPNIIKYGKNGLLNAELWSEYSPQVWEKNFLPEIKAMCQKANIPLIISLGYSKEELLYLVPMVDEFADAYEISTHYVERNTNPIYEAVEAVKQNSNKPVFIKISPHTQNFGELAKAVEKAGGDGIVAINSLGPVYHVNLKYKRPYLGSKNGYGWLSGAPIKPIALRAVKEIKEATSLPVIGVGGIFTEEDVLEFITAGASCVQILSAALLNGVKQYEKIIKNLPKAMERFGFSSIKEIIGIALKNTPSIPNYKKLLVNIDHKKCVKCGICVSSCHKDALIINETLTYKENLCSFCGLCESVCPHEAIKLLS